MENCSRPNSGTVSYIQIKMAQVLTTQVASRDMTPRSRSQRSRSQSDVAYSVKNWNNSVVLSSSYILGG